jgi:4-alpha-glucanotransferase
VKVDPNAWGIDTGYHDMWGNRRAAPESTINAILESMEAEGPGPPESPVLFVHSGTAPGIDRPADLVTEDGGSIRVAERLPPDIPLGYHKLVGSDGSERRVIVTPGRCFLPDGLRIWGWAVQAYALRSNGSWGFGDFGDLRRLTRWSERLGANMTMLNPLHATDPHPTEASPYFPSSRCARNPLYLAIEDLPGSRAAGSDLGDLAIRGRRLNAERTIDRTAVHELKSAALAHLWERWAGDREFDAFSRDAPPSLAGWANFLTIAEIHGPDWHAWPPELRHPDNAAVRELAAARADRVEFHKWVQWLVARQLERASQPLPLFHDLAIGVSSRGADAWMWQDQLARVMTIGAPPDDFNLSGQNWGVLAFDPWKLRASGYEPFIQTIRSALEFGGGLRYDHVMGLFRLFWIPDGRSPSEGTYVRYPFNDLLDIIALESHRARAVIVGEDLGTVEPFVREELARRAVLSYRLLWFEPSHPRDYPVPALAAVTNHDLPTVAGIWNGGDILDQERAGVRPNYDFAHSARARIREALHMDDGAPAAEVVAGVYRLLAQAPSAVLAATLDDALAVEERPNLPGTTDQRANWSLALPLSLEDIEVHPGPQQVAEILRAR